ncbi:hypothetical protein AB0O29_34520, partial [Streptomyces sp. NPDC089915]
MNAVLLAAVVLTAALALGVLLLLRTRLLARRSAATAYFAGAVACAALAGSLVTPGGGAAGAAGAAAGGPVLGAVPLGGRQVPVLVVPNRPGFNLVAVAAPDASAGTGRDRLAKGGPRPGSALTWVPVELPAGPGRVWVSAGGAVAALPVDTGRAGAAPAPAGLRGADGPECASAAAGSVLGGGAKAPAGCPADALTPADAAALRETVSFLAGRGARAVSLVEDGSPRGRAAAAEVRGAAARAGISVSAPDASSRRPLVVTSGWAGADAAVHDVEAGRTVAEGTYLAPWLLTAPLLSPSAGQLIPLRYSPGAPAAVESILSRMKFVVPLTMP